MHEITFCGIKTKNKANSLNVPSNTFFAADRHHRTKSMKNAINVLYLWVLWVFSLFHKRFFLSYFAVTVAPYFCCFCSCSCSSYSNIFQSMSFISRASICFILMVIVMTMARLHKYYKYTWPIYIYWWFNYIQPIWWQQSSIHLWFSGINFFMSAIWKLCVCEKAYDAKAIVV